MTTPASLSILQPLLESVESVAAIRLGYPSLPIIYKMLYYHNITIHISYLLYKIRIITNIYISDNNRYLLSIHKSYIYKSSYLFLRPSFFVPSFPPCRPWASPGSRHGPPALPLGSCAPPTCRKTPGDPGESVWKMLSFCWSCLCWDCLNWKKWIAEIHLKWIHQGLKFMEKMLMIHGFKNCLASCDWRFIKLQLASNFED